MTSIAPTSDAMRALGAQLLTDALVVFPVRHHSPASAWQLERLLETLAPSAILVEGPRGFTGLIPLLVHAARSEEHTSELQSP